MFSKSEIRTSNIETSTNVQRSKRSPGVLNIRVSSFRGESPPRGLFALVRLGRSRFDSENRFAILHQIEPVARDRFQISRIGLEQIHFTGLAGEQYPPL